MLDICPYGYFLPANINKGIFRNPPYSTGFTVPPPTEEELRNTTTEVLTTTTSTEAATTVTTSVTETSVQSTVEDSSGTKAPSTPGLASKNAINVFAFVVGSSFSAVGMLL
ncbi:unnamed protein product [Dicrocoelium dendriticum]|nr:unnamed protein product [Dicrocoelium dendriticum]